jgi:hypothetical protein
MVMAPKSTRFKCPHCGTAYQIVQIETDEIDNTEISCLACGQPLPAAEGHFMRKYFLVDTPRRSSRGHPIAQLSH